MSDGKKPQGSVEETKISALLLALVISALVVWLILFTFETFGLVLPQIPLLVPVVMGSVAIAVGIGARVTYRQIQIRKELLEPKSALQRLALGKAASLTGAVILGAYLAVALYSFPHILAELAAWRFWTSLATAVAALVLAIAGFCLERACRVPPKEHEQEN